MAEDELLVEVEDLGDDELRGLDLEVSFREDIGHGHNRVVGRMVKALGYHRPVPAALSMKACAVQVPLSWSCSGYKPSRRAHICRVPDQGT